MRSSHGKAAIMTGSYFTGLLCIYAHKQCRETGKWVEEIQQTELVHAVFYFLIHSDSPHMGTCHKNKIKRSV